MNEFGLVFWAEFTRKVSSRPFLVGTIAGMISVAILALAPAIFARTLRSSSSSVILVGPPALRARALPLLRNGYDVVEERDTLPVSRTAELLDARHKATAAIVLSLEPRRLRIDVYSRDLSQVGDELERTFRPLQLSIATGADSATVESLAHSDLRAHAIDARFASADAAELGHGVAFGLIFVLYLSIIITSQSVLASVAEEKTSRIAELLVATISPVRLLAGKVMAAGTLGVLQLAAWGATGLMLAPLGLSGLTESAVRPGAAGALADVGLVAPATLVIFLAFFVVGFVQFATIYAAAASLISRTEDLGSVATPVILPVVGAFFLAQYASFAPNAPISVIASFIPFVSPFVMFTRCAISNVPPIQLALALIINVAAAFGSFVVAGKVYRVGLLMYGKLPSLRQIIAAVQSR
jgi:ABC-2 type transport system permease protein